MDSLPEGEQRCVRCEELKSYADFHRSKNSKTGYRSACKECRKPETRAYNQKNAATIRARTRAWEEANPERKRVNAARYRERNRERIRERGRDYHERNRAEINARIRQRYHADIELARAKKRVEASRYKETRRAYHLRRYARDPLYRKQSQRWKALNRSKTLASAARYRAENKEACNARIRDWGRRNPEKRKASSNKRRALLRQAVGTHTAQDIKTQMVAQRNRCYWCGKRCAEKYHVDHRLPLAKGGTNGPENIVISCPTCNLSKGIKLPWEFTGRLL